MSELYQKVLQFNQEDWEEIRRKEGKEAGVPYTVPDKKNSVVSIRFPEIYKNQEIIILVRKPKAETLEDT